MAVQKRLAQLGFKKQSARGAAETAPLYTIGLTGGSVYKAEVNQSELNTSWSNRGLQGHDRMSVIPGLDAEAVAMPKSVGLLLLLACGAVTTTGSGTPYQHVFKPAATLPYASIFGLFGTTKTAITDAKIDSLEFSWEKTGALKLKVAAMGITFVFDSTWAIGSTGEVLQSGTFSGNTGTFQVNGADTRITAGTIKIENQVEAVIGSASSTPDEVFEGDVKCSVSLTIVPDDLNLFRNAVTGSDGGTTISSHPVYATIDCSWVVDADHDLAFNAPNAAFIADMPTVDPNGGPAEFSVEATCAVTSGEAAPFSFTLHNSVASY